MSKKGEGLNNAPSSVITERKQAEEALKESETKFKTIVQNIRDVVFQLSPLGIIQYVSPKVQEVYGYEPEDLIGKHLKKTTPISELPKALNALKTVLSGKVINNFEINQLNSKGKIIPMEINVAPVRRGDKIIAVQGVMRDITERKQMEEALQKAHHELEMRVEERTAELTKANEELQIEITERKRAEEELKSSEERLQILFEFAPDAYYLNDLKGNFIDGNKAAEEITGYKRDELIGKSFLKLKLLPPKQIPKAAALLAKNMLGQSTGPDEFILNRKDGTQVPVEIRTFPTKIKGKTVVLGIARDITERKRMEQELRATNEELQATKEELEDRVKERTAELEAANKELRETQEQLIRSERLAAIGQLAGGVGHELRNPLGAIKNAVYYVRGKVAKSELGQQEPRVLQFLEIIDEEIDSSNKIINDLLGFSRVGKPAVSPTRIEKVIEDALSRTPLPENIELAKKLDADLPEVNIDPDQIQQVLINMITNAVQAMPEGGKLTIGAREEGKFLEVEIADAGVGIPQEVRDKIFEPLFTTKAKGIGLGLAVCKAIIDRHEGNIEVKSQAGKGTTFNIKLPLKAA